MYVIIYPWPNPGLAISLVKETKDLSMECIVAITVMS